MQRGGREADAWTDAYVVRGRHGAGDGRHSGVVDRTAPVESFREKRRIIGRGGHRKRRHGGPSRGAA